MGDQILLQGGGLQLTVELRDIPPARRLVDHLPCSLELSWWGAEGYGSIAVDLGEHDPRPTIPVGGVAYSRRGYYLCLFFGQTPAWPVDLIGQVTDGDWQQFLARRPRELYISARSCNGSPDNGFRITF